MSGDNQRPFGRLPRVGRSIGWLWSAFLGGTVLLLLAGRALNVEAQGPQARGKVVVYASQDQVYAEPILKEFERQTGIRVQALYDSEAVKTVGMANRILAERRHPQCDLFWNNEELRTRQLAAQGVFQAKDGWKAFGYRSRRIVINTNLLSLAAAPRHLSALTNRLWERRVALAYPLFGTTATHFLALRQAWGKDVWEAWCRALNANRPYLVDGNSVVAKFVARGEAWIGLTDSDDIAAEQRAGAPLVALPISEETLLIPNTVAVIEGAPHRAAAEQLAAFLQQSSTREKLMEAHALEGSTTTAMDQVALRPQWDAMLDQLQPATETMQRIFLR